MSQSTQWLWTMTEIWTRSRTFTNFHLVPLHVMSKAEKRPKASLRRLFPPIFYGLEMSEKNDVWPVTFCLRLAPCSVSFFDTEARPSGRTGFWCSRERREMKNFYCYHQHKCFKVCPRGVNLPVTSFKENISDSSVWPSGLCLTFCASNFSTHPRRVDSCLHFFFTHGALSLEAWQYQYTFSSTFFLV